MPVVGPVPGTQWAAVSTRSGANSEPPQVYVLSGATTVRNPTKGSSPSAAGSPPTMLGSAFFAGAGSPVAAAAPKPPSPAPASTAAIQPAIIRPAVRTLLVT